MKIAVISQSQQCLDDIGALIGDAGQEHQLLLLQGGAPAASVAAEREHPDIVMLEGACQGSADLHVLAQTMRRFPGIAVIILCSPQTPEFLIEAMRVGVREVLPSPPTRAALLDALARVQDRMGQSATHGKILAFVPCKGGSGATFLAANLAYAIAALEGKKVALFDLNLQFGDALLFVHDRPAATSIADLARQIQRIDGSLLKSSMVEVLPNFGVLPAPEDPEKAVDVKPEHISVLLKLAVRQFDFVVIDLGRILDAVTIRALDQADMIFPVLQETLPFIRDAKRMLNVFHSLGYAREKICPIVNRYEKGGEVTLDDVEKTLDLKVFRTIPNSFSVVAESVNQGVPVLKLAKRDAVARSLEEMAHELVCGREQRGGWMRHLFSRPRAG